MSLRVFVTMATAVLIALGIAGCGGGGGDGPGNGPPANTTTWNQLRWDDGSGAPETRWAD